MTADGEKRRPEREAVYGEEEEVEADDGLEKRQPSASVKRSEELGREARRF